MSFPNIFLYYFINGGIYIFYWFWSKKNGKHSVKEFLDIMNKNFNIECSQFLTDLDYKPCKQYTEMEKHNKSFFNNNRTKKYKKTAKKRNCNLEEYIKFSGAEKNN
jgi:hypothetical protein